MKFVEAHLYTPRTDHCCLPHAHTSGANCSYLLRLRAPKNGASRLFEGMLLRWRCLPHTHLRLYTPRAGAAYLTHTCTRPALALLSYTPRAGAAKVPTVPTFSASAFQRAALLAMGLAFLIRRDVAALHDFACPWNKNRKTDLGGRGSVLDTLEDEMLFTSSLLCCEETLFFTKRDSQFLMRRRRMLRGILLLFADLFCCWCWCDGTPVKRSDTFL